MGVNSNAETKGLHLSGNLKTDYIKKVFDICTKQAKSRTWSEFGLQIETKTFVSKSF